MEISIEKEVDESMSFDYEQTIRDVISEALDFVECPYESSVNVLLTDDEQIREMNFEFRGIDRATDVLSFPMIAYEAAGDFSDLEEQDDCFDPDTGELLLGDIVISIPRAKEQAVEYGHSLRRELAFLVAHSMLHLCGYDHMEEDERIRMEEKQEAILRRLQITRDATE